MSRSLSSVAPAAGLTRRDIAALGAGGLMVGAALFGSAARAQTRQVTRTNLQTRALWGTGQELRLDLIVFPGGAASPPHRHPFGGLNYILEGVAETAYANDPPRRYRAGESFQDEAGRVHTLFRNPDPDAALKFLISYVVASGGTYLLLDPTPTGMKP